MKYFYLISFFIFNCFLSFGQMTSNEKHPLYAIEYQLKSGEINALFELIPYLDSKEELVERFAYNHISAYNESDVAKRILSVYTLFSDSEFTINDSTSSNDLIVFLNTYNDKITFSKDANAFLITPLENRPVNIQFRHLTKGYKKNLKKEYQNILSSIENPEIISLINNKDPKSLYLICAALFRERDWLNTFSFDSKLKNYIKLLQILTDFEIGVEGDFNKMTWHIESTFYTNGALNLLCYFAANYNQFSWNNNKSIFENPKIHIMSIGNEKSLFQLLSSKDDKIAMDAFIQLTTCNPKIVAELADEYEDNFDIMFERNYSLPTFPYRFLKQIVVLTDYCTQNDINFIGTEKLRNEILLLGNNLSFSERRDLEDKMINTLTLDEITAFEYWSLIYENEWGITHSVGRILDIFYSKHWNQLLENPKYLECFLKKSYLFEELGIIGICNNYLIKFTDYQQQGIDKLNSINTQDPDIINQIKKAKEICFTKIELPDDPRKTNDANYDIEISHITDSIQRILKETDNDLREDLLEDFLSNINYFQIGEAMEAIKDVQFTDNKWDIYTFLDRDFGFFYYSEFDSKKIINQFIADYNQYSEFDFYKNMLNQAGTNYFNEQNGLDYDKIYDALKYNLVDAFVGGGGGTRDNEVYAIIKILELTHKTTLGYPKKLCNSKGVYGCDSKDRANYWMQFIQDQNLLKNPHNEPVSFHYNYE